MAILPVHRDPKGRRLPGSHARLRRAVSAAVPAVAVLLMVGCAAESADDKGSPQRADVESASDRGNIVVNQVRQMSVVIEAPEGVIYTDPTGGGDRYADHPAPDVILVSHEHHEHYDVGTLEDLIGPDTRLVVPPYVMDSLPADLRENAVSLANGERSDPAGIVVEAIPAYGLSGGAERWHPPGRGNGYVVTVDDRRVYVAGSTEATPEMLALEDIHLALLPLYPPYALGPDDAVDAVSTFLPDFTHIYQYNSEATRDDFVQRMDDSSIDTIVVAPDITP